MTTQPTPDAGEPKPVRMTQGEIIRTLLDRGSAGGSSVTIARNAKGETQFEVVVRTGSEPNIATAIEAMDAASRIYDELAAMYPIGGSNAA